MQYPMRRKDRELSQGAALELLQRCEYGILSTVGEDGLPYGIPLSYVVFQGSLYFHSAMTGRKLNNLAICQSVSFCAVGATMPIFDQGFSTCYESVMVSGKVRKVDEITEKKHVLELLAVKYLPEHRDKAEHYIQKSLNKTKVFAVSIDVVSGKAKHTPNHDTAN